MRKRKKRGKKRKRKQIENFSPFFLLHVRLNNCMDLGSDSAKKLIFKFRVKKQKINRVELPKYLIRSVYQLQFYA